MGLMCDSDLFQPLACIYTHLAYRKSYLVIICPNSHEKLTKSNLGQVGVGSNIAPNHSSKRCRTLGSHTCSLFAPFHMQS